MSSVSARSEIHEAYTWDLTDLYADDAAWEAAYEDVENRIDSLTEYQGRVTEDAETLQEVLELREDIMRHVSNVTAYARMRKDEDTTNQRYQAFATRAQSLAADASSAASFIEPELQADDEATIDAYLEANPDLAEYDHYFDDVLRMKEHTRSAEIEAVLADLSEVVNAGGDVYNMFTNADLEFPVVDDPDGESRRITLSNFTTLQKHPDRAFRHRVYEAFYDEWRQYRNAIATAYKNSVKADSKLAKTRYYESARAAALDRPNIPVDVYDTLVDTVESNLDVLHRHAELKRDRLDVAELQMWDLYAPLTGGETPDLEYDKAREYVVAAVEPLGDAYQDRMATGLESRWVDVYETENKQSGAYSGGTYDSQPYILLNFQNDISSMFTLAHELGHSMHSELTSESQPYVYSGYEIFVAEVASTVNEALLTHHLLDAVDDAAFRRHVLDEYLERFRSTLFRQTMFASFEHQAHELNEAGEALTPDRLDEIYHDLKTAYYDPAVVDDRIAMEWMRIPHFYSAYYVYQYATGISAANAIVDRILSEGEDAATEYLDFLRSGARGYPLELLEIAGIDMSTPQPVEAAITAYDDLIVEFESLH